MPSSSHAVGVERIGLVVETGKASLSACCFMPLFLRYGILQYRWRINQIRASSIDMNSVAPPKARRRRLTVEVTAPSTTPRFTVTESSG